MEFSATRFQVLTAVLKKKKKKKKKKKERRKKKKMMIITMMMMMVIIIQVFWHKTSCRLAKSCRRFGEAYCLVAWGLRQLLSNRYGVVSQKTGIKFSDLK